MKDLTGVLQPQTYIGHSLIQHRLRILQAHIYTAIWCGATHTCNNKTDAPYDYMLHMKQWAFVPTRHRFMQTKLAKIFF